MWRAWEEESHFASEEIENCEFQEPAINEPSTSNSVTNDSCKSRIHLSVDAKNVISNVYTTLVERGMLQAEALKETVLLTKHSYSTVWRSVNKPAVERRKRKDSGTHKSLERGDEETIRIKIYKMYEEQIIPTLDSLMDRLKSDETGINCKRTTLWKTLKRIGFQFKKIDKRQVIMESARLQKWKLEYLSKIKQYREEQRSIIYLDETWFDTHDTPSKGWVDSSSKCRTNAPSNRGQRITIIHAGSEKGWVPNALCLSAKNIKDSCLDYHEDTTAEVFEDWFATKLLPNIPPNSIIVMDNASYHSRQLNKAPCSNDTKADIQEYMHNKDIYFHENYTKKELLEVLKAFNIKKEYTCDNLAESLGHTVLRLPPYYCIFNPIEQMWHQLKSGVRRRNTCPRLNATVLKLIQEEMEKIPDSSWANCVQHVQKIENSYYHLTNTQSQLSIRIQLNDSSDSDTDLF